MPKHSLLSKVINDFTASAIQTASIIVLVGSTASGKSELAVELAKWLGNADIINADAYAIYQKMDIGTAKISAYLRNELLQEWGITHYQIDRLPPTERISVAEYTSAARVDIETIQSNGRTPIICGGSGLYVRALTDGFQFQQQNMAIRAKYQQLVESDGIKALYARLQELDAQAAKLVDPLNVRRIVRAFEVIESNSANNHASNSNYIGKLPEYTYANPQTLQIGIEYPREQLDQRIAVRTEKMRNLGLLDEVRQLYQANLLGETAIKAIGYAECVRFINGERNLADGSRLTVDATFDQICSHTRRLVRRQLSWFKRDPRIHWVMME